MTNEPISTFAKTLNQTLSLYTRTGLSSDQINRIYKNYPYGSPTMFASTIYLLGTKNINSEEEFKDKIKKTFEDQKFMKTIYEQHKGKKKIDDKFEKMVQMDLIRYAIMYLGISIPYEEKE